MTFVVHVTYWAEYINDCKGGYKSVHCFLTAESLTDAMEYVCNYYGADCIEKVTLETFGPDQMLSFEVDNVEENAMFYEIYNQLKPKQIW